ncbi:MAG: hypothetical protein LZF86_110441 [Nitrospira sp.]|nr:MAG: hypothetical protein LZF86_110441 [Nitrospira sp.]
MTAEIADYTETFYNRIRRHSDLSGVRPETFEAVSNRAQRVRKRLGRTASISTIRIHLMRQEYQNVSGNLLEALDHFNQRFPGR